MSENEAAWFEENGACRGCEHLEACREAKEPRRMSCWIHFCRDSWYRRCQKRWKEQLGDGENGT